MKKFLLILPFFLWSCGGGGSTEPEPPQLPTVQNFNLSAVEDTPKVFTFVGNDPQNLALTFSISTQPQHGTLLINGASGTYTPNSNFNGQDSFLYLASSVNGNSNIGTVIIDIVPVDDTPNTMDTSAITDEDNAVNITLEAEEVDGDNIIFQIRENPSNGSVSISENVATYSPDENWFGTDEFTFEAVDNNARSILNIAKATITVNPINDTPTVDNIDDLEAFINIPLEITLIGNDIDNDNLTYSIVNQPSNGTVSLNGNIITYTGQVFGTDNFTYKVNDGTSDSNIGTVSLSVTIPKFNVTFGGSNGSEEVESLNKSPDGGYSLFGYTSSFGSGALDWYFVKTDALGNEEFSKTYGTNGSDNIRASIITSDDDYILVGFSNAGSGDKNVMKINASGDEIWTKSFNDTGSGEVVFQTVNETSDGNYIIAGRNFEMIKINSSGDKIWNRQFSGGNFTSSSGSEFESVFENSEGNLVFAGYGITQNNGRQIILLKTNSSGDDIWHKEFGGSQNDYAQSTIMTSDGGYLIAGRTYSFGAGASDGYLIKTDSSGDELWSQTYGESDDETIESVIESTNGGYIFTGLKRPPSGGGPFVWLVKVDDSGNEEWSKTFNGVIGSDILESDDGGIVIGGYIQSNGRNDMLLIKVDSQGNRIF